MDPRKLRKLLEILAQFGVKEYRTEEIQLTMGETPSEPSKSFTMDDYFEEPEREREGEAMSVQDPMYTEEQMLFWSADQ
ncbi:MAG: hypothetical protein CL398_07325 [Acidiferrobacteraceae bacterium]|nr:hypothetical protein [Acidiferrobacteraceae bacterium]|tara:strand:- start:1428 stop:1664 length:237 start_codon:yes stop_codon:yes gene_type:complete